MHDHTDRTTQHSWRQLRLRLTLLYLVVGVALLIISGIGHARLLSALTGDMWFTNYGWALIAGFCWLLVGGILLSTSREWTAAVEGITLLPPAILFLLYSQWGSDPAGLVVQLLWIPAFALLGAAFIHLSLTYRPAASMSARRPRFWIDGAPYMPLLALLAFDVSMLLDLRQRANAHPVYPGAWIRCTGRTHQPSCERDFAAAYLSQIVGRGNS